MDFTTNILAERMSRLGGDSAFAVLAEAQKLEAEGQKIVHLEIGQPDFVTPRHIMDAAAKAMYDGNTGYPATPGIYEVRQSIARYLKRYKNVDAAPEEVVVVPGGKPIMFFIMQALINPGDEVIYPNPGFMTYESCITYSGGVPVPMPILMENEFKVDIEGLRKLVSDKTKLIIINNPANPTGGVMDEADIRKIAEIVRGTRAFVLSDEIYDRLIFDETPFSIASIPDMKERTIILDGMSKTYAMTGWRLGYGAMNRALAEAVTGLMVNSNSCTCNFTQRAIIAALEGPQDAVELMKNAYRERAAYMAGELNKIDGFSCLVPKGAFYLFPSIKKLGIPSREFARRLLYEGGVAALWGTAFGQFGEGHIRFSVATSMENLALGARRIRRFVETL